MKQPLRILYFAGPGDVINTYRHWARGQEDPTQLSMTYSGMFYEACRAGGDMAYVIGCNPRKDHIEDEQFILTQRATLFPHGPGPLFHVGQMWTEIRLIASALWYHADVAVVACGSTSWMSLRLLPILGIKVIPSLHCVLWSKYRPLKPFQRLIRRLRVPFFQRSAYRILSASEEITAQIDELTDHNHRPIVPFLPSYRPEKFSGISAPSQERKPFRVFFAGRIERNKGVFDLLTIAMRFASEGRSDIEFDLCGNGSALESLKQQAEQAGVADRFRCHGHCNWDTMRQMYTDAHTVVVPTTGDFVEGFNQVVAEAILAGRPVITSEVCPALAYVRDAVVEVPVDDVKAYGDAMLRLCDDRAFYDAKHVACLGAQEQFYDLGRSWMAAVNRVLNEVRVDRGGVVTSMPSALHGKIS